MFGITAMFQAIPQIYNLTINYMTGNKHYTNLNFMLIKRKRFKKI